MAQLPGDARINQYTASAGQTTFTYDYYIKEDDELFVQQNSTTLTLTTDYIVTGAGNPGGGTIVLVTGATLNDIITITGNYMVERETTFTNGGDFAAGAINGEYDNILYMMSEVVTKLDRAVSLEVYTPSFDVLIPTPVANRAIKVNAAGDGFEMSTNDPDEQSGDAQAWAIVAEGHADDALVYATDASSYADDAAGDAAAAAQSAIDAQQSADDAAASAASVNFSAVDTNIVPDATMTRSLGTYSNRWSQVWGGDGLFYGQLFASLDLNVSGSIKVATDKFTVAPATGNTVVAGTLTVGGNPITIPKTAVFTYQVGAYVAGGTYTTANTWQIRPLNTVVHDNIGITFGSNTMTLPAGTYMVWANASFSGMMAATHIYSTSPIAGELVKGQLSNAISGSRNDCTLFGVFVIGVSSNLVLEQIGNAAMATTGMGYPSNIGAFGDNVFTTVMFTKLL